MSDSQELRILGVIGVAALALGFVLPEWMLFLTTVAIGKALVVLGLLLLWRAGLVSFGQALYFASGAYAAGLAGKYLGVGDMIVLLAIGGLAGGLMAFLAGFLLARYREIFFAMLSLALSMILFGVLVKSESLGSTDGISLPEISLVGVSLADDSERVTFIVAVVIALICAVASQLYLRSILGRAAEPIRDNEVRVEYLGISVRRLVHAKLTVAGLLAGLGGALTAMAVGHIDPEMAYWTTSGGFVFIAILAGAGSAIAPFLGAMIFEAIRSFAMANVPEYWQIILGGALLISIFFLPGGIWSLFEKLRKEGGKTDDAVN